MQKTKISNVTEIKLAIGLIPDSVIMDTMGRVVDWLAGGGKPEDQYIKRQIEYINEVIEHTN